MELQRSGSAVQWAWVSFLIFASVSAQAAQTPTEDKQAWTARMRKMAELVRSLQVDLADRSAAGEKDRNQRLAGHAAQLAKIAHEIPPSARSRSGSDASPAGRKPFSRSRARIARFCVGTPELRQAPSWSSDRPLYGLSHAGAGA